MKESPAVAALRKAAKGLQFISETEASLEPFVWTEAGEPNAKRVRELAGADAETTIEEMTLGEFFRAVSKEDKPKFDKLAQVLGEQLTGVKVYKLGDEAEKEAYIVGKTADGHWAGLKTTVVET